MVSIYDRRNDRQNMYGIDQFLSRNNVVDSGEKAHELHAEPN